MSEPHVPQPSRLRQLLRAATLAPRAGLSLGTLLILAALLLLFRGFGSGISITTNNKNISTNKIPSSPPATASTTAPDSDSEATPRSLKFYVKPPDQPDVPTPPAPPNPPATPTSPILTLLIDERSYRHQLTPLPEPIYREISLEQIQTLARKTTGDVNGIRIRILRRQTARQAAEIALLNALQQVGITPDAILMPSDTVP